MEFYRAELVDTIRLAVGTTVQLESLRQAVVPPYYMLMPFIEVPDCIVVEGQQSLEEDGIHGCIYILRSVAVCEGEITIGFRDMQTHEITHSKAITLVVSDVAPPCSGGFE